MLVIFQAFSDIDTSRTRFQAQPATKTKKSFQCILKIQFFCENKNRGQRSCIAHVSAEDMLKSPMVIIWTNLVVFKHPMPHTKFQGHRPFGSGEEDFFKVSTIYGHDGNLSHVTRTVWTNFRSPIPWRLHMKFGFSQLSGFWGEDVWRVLATGDGRRRPTYPIS